MEKIKKVSKYTMNILAMINALIIGYLLEVIGNYLK